MGRGRNNKDVQFATEDRCGAAHNRLVRKRFSAFIRQVHTPVKTRPPSLHGHVYTVGVASLHTPKIEFISLNVPREEMEEVGETMMYIIKELQRGCLVFDNLEKSYGINDTWTVGAMPTSNRELLKHWATECDKDVTLMLLGREGSPVVVPSPAPADGRKKHMYSEFPTTEPHVRYETDHCDGCGAKSEDDKQLLRCNGCQSAMFCSAECQRKAWKGHKKDCRAKMLEAIKATWKRGGSIFSSGDHVKVPIHNGVHVTCNKHPSGLLPQQRGMFIRHLNGDFLDNAAKNLVDCHPYLAFIHPDWEVDWWAGLTKDQRSYVKKNMGAFAKCYEPQKDKGMVSHDQAFELLAKK